jgi:hypothetical protein
MNGFRILADSKELFGLFSSIMSVSRHNDDSGNADARFYESILTKFLKTLSLLQLHYLQSSAGKINRIDAGTLHPMSPLLSELFTTLQSNMNSRPWDRKNEEAGRILLSAPRHSYNVDISSKLLASVTPAEVEDGNSVGTGPHADKWPTVLSLMIRLLVDAGFGEVSHKVWLSLEGNR